MSSPKPLSKSGKKAAGRSSAGGARESVSSHTRPSARLSANYSAGVAPALTLGVQPKFTVGRADDPFEREADTVADRVVAGQAPPSITAIPAGGLPGVAQKEESPETAGDERAEESLQKEAVEPDSDSDEPEALQAERRPGMEEDEAEEAAAQPELLQREAETVAEPELEPSDEPGVQPHLLQREAVDDEEAGAGGESIEALQPLLLQRREEPGPDADESADEPEPVQAASESMEDEEDAARPMLLQRACAECEKEEPDAVQAGRVVQRKVDFPSLPEATEAPEKSGGAPEEDAEAGAGGEPQPEEAAKEGGEGEEETVAEPELEPYEPEEKMPPPVQAKSAGTGRRKRSGGALLQGLSGGGSGGTPLEPPVRREMERGLGRDLSGVRVHTGGGAAQMNKELGARAFTHRGDIYFAPGQYQPDSRAGKHLLAHELAHTVQQGAAGNAVQCFNAPAQNATVDPPAQRPNDGEEVEGRMDEKLDEERDDKDPDDLSEEEREEAESPDRGEVRRDSSELKNSGQASPSVDRGAEAERKTAAQKAEVDQQVSEQSQEAGEEEGEGEQEQAELSEADAAAERARAAEERAMSIEIPARPEPFRHPRIEAPVDSAGEPLPRQGQMDTQVRGLGYIAEMLREKGYEMKRAASEKEMGSYSVEAVIEKEREDLANAREGTATMEEHNVERKDIAAKSREAHTESVERQQFVADKAPDLAAKADEGGEDSGALARESGSKAERAQSEVPDDEDARADAEEQSGDMQDSAEGAASMDRAVTQTGERARRYERDAEQAAEQNQQSEGQIDETDNLIEQTDARLEEMNAANDASDEQIENVSGGPETIREHASQTAQTGDELIAATLVMEQELNALQEEYLAGMRAIESREEAEERLRREQERSGEQPDVPPEVRELAELAQLSDAEQEQRMAEMDQEHRDRLLATLEEMIQQSSEQEGAGAAESAPDSAGPGGGGEQGGPPDDPRAEQIQAVDGRREQRVSGVLDVADRNMSYLTAAQQRMLAQRLVEQSIVDDVSNINVLQMGKQMLMGMINPLVSLEGVVGGFDKMLSGFASIGDWEAWQRDPLGNLLKVAADISTGLAMVFSSVLGLATIITALMVVLTIASWFTLSWMTGPVIGWMGTIMTYAGWGAIIAGGLSVYFNYLSYIKNLHDAGTAETARELLDETGQMRENANDGFTGAMAVVEGVGAVKMGPRLSGGEFFQRVPRTPRQALDRVATGARRGAAGLAAMPGRIGRGIQNLFEGGVEGLRRFKQRLRGVARRGDAPPRTDIPDGARIRTPRDGNLGTFDGRPVRAEVDLPGNQRMRVLDNGRCVVCASPCRYVGHNYARELAENPRLQMRLDRIEASLARNPNQPRVIQAHRDIQLQLRDARIQRPSRLRAEFSDELARTPGLARQLDELDPRIQSKPANQRYQRRLDAIERQLQQQRARLARGSDLPYDPRRIREELARRYGPENVTSTTVPPTSKPNVRLAGRHADVALPDGSTRRIVFDRRGFPIFDDVAKYNTRLDIAAFRSASYRGQMRMATRELRSAIRSGRVSRSAFTDAQWAAIRGGKAKIPGYTWHHHQNTGRMQLVPEDIHSGVSHTGWESVHQGV